LTTNEQAGDAATNTTTRRTVEPASVTVQLKEQEEITRIFGKVDWQDLDDMLQAVLQDWDGKSLLAFQADQQL